ncbi:hypothetical protein SUDANB120_06036 [Streptomyces sp. enrichment culture]|uniref:hypothetical protein n=1 Tax=Streptomyces TaxID=1883 RepID=UPI001673CF88|nr:MULTISPECIES: hypothetical protein [Streptomyces]MBD3577586.1 hypothetical protein [Streptomyces sp. KD18]GGT09754.1 hypothetical protein GCM10010286_39060 [Streptomyces toxytricini]
MLILRAKARQRDSVPAAPSTAAALPFAVSLPALAVVFGDRLGTAATAALVAAGLVLVAWTAGAAARSAARTSAEQARRDREVLDSLDPLAGLGR